MKLNKMFPRKYANGADLNGNPVTVTIKTITTEKMTPTPGQPPKENFVIYFEETIKGIILTRALAEQIAQIILSDETEEWAGKKITLYPQPMTVAGAQRIAIRARKPAQV